MKKKILGFLSLFVFILTCGICLVACGSKLVVEGSINIEFVGFTANDLDGQLYLSCSSGVSNNQIYNENGIKFVYGPEKTDSKSDICVEIMLSRVWDINKLNVQEKNGQPFTTQIRDDNDENSSRYFSITIPFAQKIDYSFTLAKPTAEINQVDFVCEDAVSVLNSQNEKIRNFLDHSQVWVENKDFDYTTNTIVGGFMPLVSGQTNEKEFALAGKYINWDLTKESLTLYLKYDNNGNCLPFDTGSLVSVFTLNEHYPTISVKEFQGTQVYAFEFKTQNLKAPASLKMGYLDGLNYLSSTINDTGVSNVYLTGDFVYEDVIYKFSRVGWKTDEADWQETALPKKEYGKKLSLKYRFEDIELGGYEQDAQTFENITDMANIKFQINGVNAKNLQYNAGEKSYTFDIEEFDTPETYSKDLYSIFTIGVDPFSIKIKANDVNGKDITFSSQFEFFRGNNNFLFSQLQGENGTTHAYAYSPNKQNSDAMTFTLKEISRYEKFKLNITLDGQNYTKEFVKGIDFLVSEPGDGDFQGAYVFKGQEEYQYLQKTNGDVDQRVYFNTSSNYQGHSLSVYVDDREIQTSTTLQFLITDIEYRKIDLEVNGNMYDGQYYVGYDLNHDFALKSNDISVTFDLKEMYDKTNIKINALIYSNDVLLESYNIVNQESSSQFDEYNIQNLYCYVEGYSSNPDLTVRFHTDGALMFIEGDPNTLGWDIPQTNALITKIVITFESAT